MTDRTLTDDINALAQRGWIVDATALRKSFAFTDFVAAFGWMTRVALLAEKADHHPEWTNVYRRVDVRLTTHDAGGVTAKDIDLAQKMDEAAGNA